MMIDCNCRLTEILSKQYLFKDWLRFAMPVNIYSMRQGLIIERGVTCRCRQQNVINLVM